MNAGLYSCEHLVNKNTLAALAIKIYKNLLLYFVFAYRSSSLLKYAKQNRFFLVLFLLVLLTNAACIHLSKDKRVFRLFLIIFGGIKDAVIYVSI